MPNKRAAGQKLLTLPASAEFIRGIDENLAACGYSNRSQFIRDAIIEKLNRGGSRVPKSLSLAPARAPDLALNEPAANSASALGKEIVEQAVSYVEKHGVPKPAPANKARSRARVAHHPAAPPTGS